MVLTGFTRNMNHIVLGVDDTRPDGAVLGLIGIAVVGGLVDRCSLHIVVLPARTATCRKVAHAKMVTLDRLIPQEHYTVARISPYFWPDGKMPEREDWRRLAAEGFKDYKLRVDGLVENPVELSLADLRVLSDQETITMHHCIQGWSGIAQWRGVPMRRVIELVKPKPGANNVAFYSFGPTLFGGAYYETQDLYNAMKPECLLAFEINGQPLPHVYGAPLRLRVENQLGYKMIKWIEHIEFIGSEKLMNLPIRRQMLARDPSHRSRD